MILVISSGIVENTVKTWSKCIDEVQEALLSSGIISHAALGREVGSLAAIEETDRQASLGEV